jgi:hypothetical protein
MLKCEYSQDFPPIRFVTSAGALSIGHALGCLLPHATIVKKVSKTAMRATFFAGKSCIFIINF